MDSQINCIFSFPSGINLKKTDLAKEKAFQKEKPDNSVEAILSRRIAVELSDSETESYDSGDDEWGDESDWTLEVVLQPAGDTQRAEAGLPNN